MLDIFARIFWEGLWGSELWVGFGEAVGNLN